MTARYTPRRLQNDLAKITLPPGHRFEYAPAYEWQGVDHIDPNGWRRRVEMGTSRECIQAAERYAGALHRTTTHHNKEQEQ